MKNRVYNSTFGKIMRTLGFLLILFSSVVISIQLILVNPDYAGISALVPFAEQAGDIIAKLPEILADYISMMFFLGFIFLIWAIRKGVIIRVVLTVGLLVMMLYTMINLFSLITPTLLGYPDWAESLLEQVEPLLNQLFDISKYILFGISVGVPLLLWYVFASKKPGRFSIFILRLGSISSFLAVTMYAVAIEFFNTMLTNELYQQVNTTLYVLAFVLFIVGGLFGVLGFYKK